MKILLVEDEIDLAANTEEFLVAQGHVVDCATHGQMAINLATAKDAGHDVCVLDLKLPDIDGLQVARTLRKLPGLHLPILMLTARDTLDDKLAGFAEGADDYLVKPFSLHELLARLTVLHRYKQGASTQNLLQVADLLFDTQQKTVMRNGKPIELRPAPMKILEYLMANSHRIVSRTELLQLLWGDEPPESDALRVYVHALRQAIDYEKENPLIHTMRGQGYRCYATH